MIYEHTCKKLLEFKGGSPSDLKDDVNCIHCNEVLKEKDLTKCGLSTDETKAITHFNKFKT